GESALAVASLETLDPATGVDQLLLAGKERVAFVAQLEGHIPGLGTPGLKGVATRAGDVGDVVVGVGVGLHLILSVEIQPLLLATSARNSAFDLVVFNR